MTTAAPIATREVSVGTHAGDVHWQQWRDRALFDERGALVENEAVGGDITDRKRSGRRAAASARRRNRSRVRCARPIAARTNSWRCSRTSCAIRWRPIRNALRDPAQLARRPRHEAVGAARSIERQVQPPDAAGRRPARHLAHHARQDRAAHARRVELVGGGHERGGSGPPADRTRSRHALTRRAAAQPIRVRGRRRSRLTQIVVEPAQQRGQVHRPAAAASGCRPRATRATWRSSRARQRHRHRGRQAAAASSRCSSQVEPGAASARRTAWASGSTLVARLVELHGGSVEARSDGLGRGSEFVVRLPAEPIDVAARPAARHRPAAKARRRSLRILAVDDNIADGAEGLASVLSMWGLRRSAPRTTALQPVGAGQQSSRRRWCCSTSSLPMVDGLEVRRGRLRETSSGQPRCWCRCRDSAQEETSLRTATRPASTITSSSRST